MTRNQAGLPRNPLHAHGWFRAAVLGLATVWLVLGAVKYFPKSSLSDAYPKSTAIYARHGELLRLTLASDGQFRLWTPLEQIPVHLRAAVLLYEDRWFYRHPGVNPWALARAAWATLTNNGRQGGSTITMQVARQLYRIDSRRYFGKLRQIAFALWLDLRYGKDEILEAYLNGVSYGGNIVGIGAASRIYFHKPAVELNRIEAVTLAVIPQNPARRVPIHHELPKALLAARQRLWQNWLDEFPEDRRYAADLALPLPVYGRSELAIEAPHLTDLLLQRCAGAEAILSSLDRTVQKSVERSIRHFLAANRDKGVRNAAALLVDTNSMQVRAMVGSADYRNAAIDGQVNGTLAKRSPGSTLKPFVYALALDQGLVHPRTILADLPTAFGPYSPENFDGRFIGPVTVQEALIRSRNVPAVRVAAKLSRPTFYQFLLRAGVSRLRDEPHYGLSLALGGGEVTMEELAELYALLINRGKLGRLNYCGSPGRAESEATEPLALLSSAAAYITLDMLKHNPRPDSKRPDRPETAWKTGTSWGFRDAWSIGIAGHYVLAVWVGNFDGTKNPALVGGKAAAPLFFSILDGLRAQSLLPGLADPIPSFKPDTVAEVEVCAASGDLPNADCPVRAKTWFIPGKSPIRTSTLHRAVHFDRQTGRIVCPDAPQSRREIVEFWDSEMLRLFEQAGMPRRPAPPLPACYRNPAEEDGGLRIISPLKSGIYALRLGKPSTLALKATTAANGNIYWFANRSFIAGTAPSETYSWLPGQPGHYLISVVDADGHAASTEIRVELAP
ncbi:MULTISPECIES: penicillin-binding protein 1C [Methylomicrobium]|uniref:peptidoglycan glycosyltransferase n=1 Tax=Methylomicrobium album BG8 TaxID=686340 RepID=H8GNA5_METAL|nr:MULTISPECIES: penicillin-binding protein 1C [Methylomicrobium]EIC28334.1 penicillin-binding protein 1C [Methylomicrobium album BG8]